MCPRCVPGRFSGTCRRRNLTWCLSPTSPSQRRSKSGNGRLVVRDWCCRDWPGYVETSPPLRAKKSPPVAEMHGLLTGYIANAADTLKNRPFGKEQRRFEPPACGRMQRHRNAPFRTRCASIARPVSNRLSPLPGFPLRDVQVDHDPLQQSSDESDDPLRCLQSQLCLGDRNVAPVIHVADFYGVVGKGHQVLFQLSELSVLFGTRRKQSH
jgi:hypothetical protein